MSFVVHKNERRESRRHYVLPCRVVRERDFELIGASSLDMSADGMLVMAMRTAAIGEHVTVSFKATELGLWFDADAVVTRIVHGRRPGDRGQCIALRFARMDPVKRFILRGHLRRMTPPLPQREPRMDYAATVRRIASS
jgi:hypothetical protein